MKGLWNFFARPAAHPAVTRQWLPMAIAPDFAIPSSIRDPHAAGGPNRAVTNLLLSLRKSLGRFEERFEKILQNSFLSGLQLNFSLHARPDFN